MTFRHWQLSFLGALGIGAIAAQSAIASGQIIEANGRVLVRRGSNASYEPAAVGTILELGHSIRPDAGVRVRVLCSDGTQWTVPAGVPSGLGIGCPNSIIRSRTWGRGDADFLAFLNARFIYATQVQSVDSLLQWHPFANAPSYTLRIDGCDNEGLCDQGQIWQQTMDPSMDLSSARYTGAALQRERTYQLTLTTADEGGRSQTATLLFRLISEADVSRIQTEIAELESQDLSPEAKAIARVTIYESVAHPNTRSPEDIGLMLEAIAPLEAVADSGSQTPYLYRILGEACLQVGLLEQAEAHYQKAVNYAQAAEHARDRAAAQVALASIAAARGHLSEAEVWLQRAKVGYLFLGESRQVDDIQKWIEQLDPDSRI